ncbi:hypothetical protein B0F90DRAFT_1687294 [Multifurca ochricompacta]|uniref:Uncharacterized protein n=1 Tax=Multifurca ochricompacta TaxID=376703 RepID=A0AAD4QR45_9AGAM|nr:hypothetical protein B0F90DRAFT_1687294 [Multifurca ochricompacta]
MEYHPKHPQPFSYSEALRFDPTTITEEIARLQNSLRRLKHTQDELCVHPNDPELVEVLRENEAVIASQEERVQMLNMALVEKGIPPALPPDVVVSGSNEDNEDNDSGVML